MSGRILTTSHGLNREAFTAGDWGLFLAIGSIWGASFLFIDIGLDALRPGAITWLRIVLGAAAMGAIPAARRRIEPIDRPRVLALSLIWVAVPFTLFPLAQQHINSAVTGMLNGGMPLFTAVIASALLGHLPGRAQTTGILVGLAGVAAISLPSMSEGRSQALGVTLVLVAVMLYGLAVNIAAPIQQRYGSLPVMSRMLAFGALWTAPFGFYGLAGSRFAWAPAAAVTVLGVVGTGLAYFFMGNLVGRVGSTRASFISYLIPLVATVLGVAVRGDRITAAESAGIALVIAGALLASRRER
jgi:drug/metabolite transporter (DMT)-like permease